MGFTIELCAGRLTCSAQCRKLAGKVKVGAINCEEEKSVCQDYSIQGFPTLKFFGKNKKQPQDYQGSRDASSIADFSLTQWAKNAPAPEVRGMLPCFSLQGTLSCTTPCMPADPCRTPSLIFIYRDGANCLISVPLCLCEFLSCKVHQSPPRR
jgi:hypothetical protein